MFDKPSPMHGKNIPIKPRKNKKSKKKTGN
jgi:hypothetical protein